MNDDVVIEFNQAAFRHGVTKADIHWAFDTARYDSMVDENEEDFENKRLLIGFDRNANPLEILYNVIDENSVNVFHAMKCRNTYIHLIDSRRL
jgi:uncharacterized DUF497 family protein